MTAPLRGPEFRLTLLGARCCPPAGGLLSGPHFKRGLATGGSVGPQRTRGTEGGHWLGCRAFRAAAQRSDAGSEVGRVWGVTQQQTAAPPLSAAAQGPAWWPLRCGAAADAHGVTGPLSGHRPPFGAGYADKGRPASGGLVWCLPPPPLGKVPFIGHFHVPWGDNKGGCCTPLYPLKI